jgi:hypothetical protein
MSEEERRAAERSHAWRAIDGLEIAIEFIGRADWPSASAWIESARQHIAQAQAAAHQRQDIPQ